MKFKKIKKEWRNVIFNLIFGVLTLLIIIIFYKNILLTTILVGFLAIFGLIKWRSKITLYIFIFGALFGSLTEMIAISQGIWGYTFTNFLNIPLWLIIVWGNAAAFIYQTAIEFERLDIHK